ncbi:hypothetical protein M9H77_24119 [Catharanthus roseus]|uniref:Uncharacterized protein n=1 Tax=Catharanthus roseus TaxID=4058 RepID=A0ACC0AVL7_CATRO|nr:hypothetical protein M9H77_24119 [Catharanthus roseus]
MSTTKAKVRLQLKLKSALGSIGPLQEIHQGQILVGPKQPTSYQPKSGAPQVHKNYEIPTNSSGKVDTINPSHQHKKSNSKILLHKWLALIKAQRSNITLLTRTWWTEVERSPPNQPIVVAPRESELQSVMENLEAVEV